MIFILIIFILKIYQFIHSKLINFIISNFIAYKYKILIINLTLLIIHIIITLNYIKLII